MISTEKTYARSKAIWFLAAFVTAIGVTAFLYGVDLETRNPRSNAEDMFAFLVLAIGASMSAAGVSLPFAQLWKVGIIALAAPFLTYVVAVVVVWTLAFTIYRWPDVETMVRSGYTRVPQARQVDELFGPAWHFCAKFEEPNRVDWTTTTFLAER